MKRFQSEITKSEQNKQLTSPFNLTAARCMYLEKSDYKQKADSNVNKLHKLPKFKRSKLAMGQ